jgi:hypothetical protein
MQPTIGRVVLYRLDAGDVAGIEERRAKLAEVLGVHTSALGNPVTAGQQYPADVVRVWSDTGPIQLQVRLDGSDSYWATSVAEGDGERQWSWPARV